MGPGGPPASPLMAPPSPPLMACVAISSPATCFQSWTQPVLRPRPRLLKSPPVRKDPATLWRVFVGLMPLILCKGSQKKPGSSFNTPAGHLRSYIICLTRSGSRTAGPSGDTRSAHRRLRGSCREPRSPRRRAADGCRVTPGLGGTYGAGSGRGQTYPNRSWERTPASNLVSAQLPASWSSTREPLCVCPRATRPAEGERTDAPCSMSLPSQAQAGRRAGETRGWGAGHRADQLPQSPTTPQEAPSHPRTGATPCQQWHPASSSPPTSCWPQSSPQQGRSPLDWPRTLQRLGGWGLCVLGLVPGAWAS
uniref:Homeobox protein goosecoid-2 isoform X4 n=1 Tax=Tursiops truncatus TaxID=9739 RepID=A0A6J3PT16_TURTR|nr:homeobox protein goosecoid-2 isoform X4 [Tursiops truncatus]